MKYKLFCACALLLPPALAHAAASAPAAQAVSDAHERLLPLRGVQNARDLGGYRTANGRTVRWNRIFRSAELSHLTPQDKAQLSTRGLAVIHDLRSVGERAVHPTDWTGRGAPRIVAIDYSMDMAVFGTFFRDGATVEQARKGLTATYRELLVSQRPQHRALFADLLKDRGATLYHCSAGKDRTGIATALILSALGVPRETILADYELSNTYYRPDYSQGAANNPQAKAFLQLPEDVRTTLMGVDRRYLQAVFDMIDRDYGSMKAYLDRELGVDADDLRRLRAIYTF